MATDQITALIAASGNTYAIYDPTLNPAPVRGWVDFGFHDYSDIDPTELAPMPEPGWSTRMDHRWIVQAGVVVPYVAPVATQAELIATAKAGLANIRYQHEIAGVSFTPAGASTASMVASDRDSQSKLIAVFVLASATPTMWIDGTGWKMADGSFVPLTHQDALAMSITVQKYVAACFANERALITQIEATTDAASLAAIDLTIGWPSQG